MKTILILSAGRRVELIKCFKSAAERMGEDTKIIAGDASNTAPALYFADEYRLLPRINSPNFIEAIINICQKDDVNLIVPTIDTELLPLAQNKKYIETKTHAKVMISDFDIVSICRDKRKTYDFFLKNGFLVPKMINKDDIKTRNYEYPLFIKPLDGSSSVNTFKINNEKELEFFSEYVDKPIIQKFIEGDEYTVDIFCDFRSNIVSITPRIRIVTRAGEILKGKIDKDVDVIKDITRLLHILKPIGHITVQCMKTMRGIEYIEINPRFGGGAPMSIKAGADSCEYIYRILNEEKLCLRDDAKDGLFFSRFDDCICLDENMEQVI